MLFDEQGLRLNVGIVIFNPQQNKKLFWAKRVGNQEAWQFPQGGMNPDETPVEAMYRELAEEVGLKPEDVRLAAESRNWYTYYLPKRYRRNNADADATLCIGQKQKWFLLEFIGDEKHIRFDHSETPEFNDWKWVDYWYPVNHVVLFKRAVYRQALKEFADYINSGSRC